jgi:hypothetical protein
VAALPNGQFYIAGQFSKTVMGLKYDSIIRLNSDGSFDTTFRSAPGGFTSDYVFGGMVQTILPLGDGQILVGGWFAKYGGMKCGSIARLESNGDLDTSF